jgi:hypothetical protein
MQSSNHLIQLTSYYKFQYHITSAMSIPSQVAKTLVVCSQENNTSQDAKAFALNIG